MPDNRDALINGLLDQWEETIRILESYRPVIEQIPDWLPQVQKHYARSLTEQAAKDRMRGYRQAAKLVMDGGSVHEFAVLAVAELKKYRA